MNFTKSTILMAVAAMAMTGLSYAQQAPTKVEKIVTVDVQKLFKDYYKTHEAQKELNAFRARIQAQNTERVEEIKGIEQELNDMKKKAEDTSMSEAKKKELAEKFRVKSSEGIARDKERREFLERRQRALNEQTGQKMRVIVDEINKLVEDNARKANYDLVLDRSALSAAGTKVVMFSKDSFDITPTIMKELNKDAPAGFDPSKPLEEETAAPTAPATK